MAEKKCVNCENMDFCKMYLNFVEMASLLNANLNPDMAGDLPFVYMVNALAHDCKRFRAFE
jgi:hypothetical protein